MNLTSRQMRALESICETFLPRAVGWPSALELNIPAAIAAALDFNPRSKERAEFLQLLDVWNSSLHSFFAIGKLKTFSRLSLEDRTRILLDWADSRIGKRRAVFQGLRKAIGFLHVMLPGLNQGRSPVWEHLQYPGPLNAQNKSAPKLLNVTIPDRDLILSCDVCVVGSGAGGGPAAAILSKAGLEVIVLEAGGYYDDADFDGAEFSGFQRLYSEAGFTATRDHSIGLLSGECLGGTTVINYCTSFRTPDEIRTEWAAAGVPWFTSEEYTRSLDAVCRRIHVNLDQNRVSAREQVLERGLRSLGWHVDAMPRNVVGCDQGKVCGYCGYGCPLGAKQSAAKTWLLDAQEHGARLLVESRAVRVRIEAGTATGVEAVSRAGHGLRIKCQAVVVACGSIHTPALLLRSGLRNKQIGRNLHLHPVSNVCGIFEEEIRPWEGTLQAIYSDEHRHMAGNFGVKYETTSLQPIIVAAVLPWRNSTHYRELLSQMAHMSAIGVLVRDRDGGRVSIGADGHPITEYALSDFDRGHLRKGFVNAARILEAAGARRIFSPHAKWCSYEPGGHGSLHSFAESMDAAGWQSSQVSLFAFHLQGTARLGGSPKDSACTPEGESWEVRNLFVLDGSSFPSASGVNPMISIEGIAHRNASALAARLAG